MRMTRKIELLIFSVVLLGILHCAVSRDSMLLNGEKMYNPQWCVAKYNLSEEACKDVINVYCNKPGVDCSVILPGGSCFEPNTLLDHASVVLNRYTCVPGSGNQCPEDVGVWTLGTVSSGTCEYLLPS